MESRHLVTVTDAEIAESERHPPVVALTYRLDDGPAAGTLLQEALVLSDKGIWRIVALLRALGIKGEKRNMSIPFSELTGRQMVVTVEDGQIRSYALAASARP